MLDNPYVTILFSKLWKPCLFKSISKPAREKMCNLIMLLKYFIVSLTTFTWL